jgi:triacylglycerol esterase/lipase EstA (alpha/beta hydrolase family)
MLARIKIGKYIIGILLMAVFIGWSASSAHAVTLVFIHGKGSGKDTVSGVVNNYWTPNMIQAATRNYATKYLIVSYDGSQYYWDIAGDVAGQINSYLNSNPNEKLVFVTHSYGGVVMRFILCNSAPSTPYYNYRGANFTRIASATSYALTLAAPQAGSEAANLAGTLSSSSFTSWIVSLLNENANSTKVLTTANMIYASQNWLSDSLRKIAFYSVGGTDTLNHIYHPNDVGLAALKVLAGEPSSADGLVSTYSAHYCGAPGGFWYDTTANHDHNRHNDDPGYMGNTIAQYGY